MTQTLVAASLSMFPLFHLRKAMWRFDRAVAWADKAPPSVLSWASIPRGDYLLQRPHSLME
jgi:hypothetical protein